MDGRPCWLIDLASDLRLDEVLDRIVENAAEALPGRDLALLIAGEDDQPQCPRSTGVGPGARRRLVAWSAEAGAFDAVQVVDDLAHEPAVGRLAMRVPGPGFTALRSVPLEAHGQRLGALIALSREGPLDASDTEMLAAFAEQAAIALSNALMFQDLVEQATEDALTGLPNRREFESLLRRELERSSRYGEIFSLAMLDLDGFKAVNDSHGHDAGDALLRQVAATIRETCRTADVPARYGGDEFALVLPETDQFAAAALCERLRAAIETRGQVSLSWGVAEYPTHGTKRADLLRAADAAMYASKPQEPRAA